MRANISRIADAYVCVCVYRCSSRSVLVCKQISKLWSKHFKSSSLSHSASQCVEVFFFFHHSFFITDSVLSVDSSVALFASVVCKCCKDKKLIAVRMWDYLFLVFPLELRLCCAYRSYTEYVLDFMEDHIALCTWDLNRVRQTAVYIKNNESKTKDTRCVSVVTNDEHNCACVCWKPYHCVIIASWIYVNGDPIKCMCNDKINIKSARIGTNSKTKLANIKSTRKDWIRTSSTCFCVNQFLCAVPPPEWAINQPICLCAFISVTIGRYRKYCWLIGSNWKWKERTFDKQNKNCGSNHCHIQATTKTTFIW